MKPHPGIHWIRSYQRTDLKPDLIAAATVAVLLIPQAMAYAMLAGLPPTTGLYAALASLLVYPLLGSSRHLSVGPVAIDSLLVAAGLGLLASDADVNQLTSLAIALAVLVGAIQVLMGLLRMGYLANFLADPVINGFVSAAALIIGFSQLTQLLGIDVPAGQSFISAASHLALAWHQGHLVTMAVGLSSLLALIWLRRRHPRIPGALLVVVAGSLVVLLGDLEGIGLAVIGPIPQGLPTLALPEFNTGVLADLLPLAGTLALLGFVESIAVAKRFAAADRYDINANRELASLGASNIAAGLAGGYPVAGSFGRTAINVDSGARTPLASVFTAVLVALTLVVLTPLFYYTPLACMAAIIIFAVARLVDVQEPRRLLRINRKDFALLMFAFLSTLLLGVQYGVLLSVLASILMIFSRIARPPVVCFGRLPNTAIFRNLEREPLAVPIPGVVIFRIDASLYFANMTYLKDKIYQAIAQREDPLHAFIIDASTTNEVDTSAISALQEIAIEFSQMGITLYFTNVRGRIRDTMQRSGLLDQIGAEHFFHSKLAAVEYIEAQRSQQLRA